MYKSIVVGREGIEAKVVCDSISSGGVRLTTLELQYPRFILAELNTHRMLSKNSSSSRAIPVKKMVDQVRNNPAMPVHWGKNIVGMQAIEDCDSPVFHENADWGDGKPISFYNNRTAWSLAGQEAADWAEAFSNAGYHKQIVNRLIEPFQLVKTVVTATEWSNFFKLRNHPAAQPEIAELARCMQEAMDKSVPRNLLRGEWHLPYVTLENAPGTKEDAIKCSVARCARTSYMKHDNTSPLIVDDIELYNTLVIRPYTMKNGIYLTEDDPIHGSPTEHQATPMKHRFGCWQFAWESGVSHMDRDLALWSGNFKGWIQYRKIIC